MTSWRLETKDHEVAPVKKAGSKPKKKQSDEEYDFGALTTPSAVPVVHVIPAPAASVSVIAVPDVPAPATAVSVIPVPAAPAPPKESIQPEHLLNPLIYSLFRTKLERRRRSGQSFGLDVQSTAPGVVKVIGVTAGKPAEKAGIEKDMYILAMDGVRITNEGQVKDIEKSKKGKDVHMALVKKRPIPYEAASFPLPGSIQRQPGHEYSYVRLDPTGGIRVGTGVGERDGAVYVTQILEGSAGEKARLQLDDRILAVDGETVKNRDACKKLVQKSTGNPFDLIVERAPVQKFSKPKAVAVKPPPPRDPDAGDPSMGIPQTPGDVSMVVEDTRARKAVISILHSKKKRKSTKQLSSKEESSQPKTSEELGQPKSKISRSARVKVDKSVEKKKLHKDGQNQPPPS